ncbi:hypothetical protein YC2023_053050 [Brassica napus]
MRGNEGSSNINTTIYQSKLHKKLAFLEVKVKKSSDIKKTKDMLELNNQDSSHIIVYNIHRKITSIEKSLSHCHKSQKDMFLLSLTKLKAGKVEVKPSVPVEENAK